MKTVKLVTDGACSGNPGPGGWAYLLIYGEHEKLVSGGEAQTTNNRMEMTAVIEGLDTLKESCSVHILTDSKYVLQGMTEWLPSWIERDWKTSNRKPVKNADLWIKLDALCQQHQIEWEWVKGHSGHIENERVDTAARDEVEKYLL